MIDDEIYKKHFEKEFRAKLESRKRIVWDSRVPQVKVTMKTYLEGLNKREVIESWLNDPVRNLIIKGDIGVGKTELAVLLGESVYESNNTIPMFVKYQDLFRLRLGKNDEDITTWKRLLKVDMLVVDDIMASDDTVLTDWKHETLYDLFDSRYVKNLPTVITTNLTVEQMSNMLGSRIIDRIKEGSVTFTVVGESRRERFNG